VKPQITSILTILALLTSASLLANEPIQPIPTKAKVNELQSELGKKLYFDPRLSKSGFISCNSCHNLSMGGTDNLKTSIGHNWQQGPINSPTVLNSTFNIAQFWDGRAKDLKEQVGVINVFSNSAIAVVILSISTFPEPNASLNSST
jgi:cytochrome c peroxidase